MPFSDYAPKRCEEIDREWDRLEEQIKSLQQQQNSLMEERQIITGILRNESRSFIESNIALSHDHVNGDSAGRWGKDIIKLLNIKNKLMQVKDIIKAIEKDPRAVEDSEIKRKMADALNKRVMRGSLMGYKKQGVTGKYYGLTSWFDGDEPKKEYLDAIK